MSPGGLQIPDGQSPAGSSTRHQQQSSQQSYPSYSASASRPVSAAVHPTPTSSSASPSTSRKYRASHAVPSQAHQHGGTSSATAANNQSSENDGQALNVYNHPAAVAYASAHPRRTIPKFGPYLLLQTLGEGEFGKVKLGLHNQWAEEVAVKLIRRGNVDTTVRMSKVEREIEVLRTLKHPNIVRLYDVIETDKYIGIILEYASGGELFDHILAHRYLREKDAAKLFSQLISGVWYIHQKKIVHRDLKLENLLLDRHRNVIITDFGFANRFEHRPDDLMQTSCGSPCYAAPELVISEGLYVGSAVDIWSCGVILYAMLAGYLPFDDDPANPDGDNINLLYKYIVNTPLSFPDYISSEARDLLGMMLVPDPTRRASLEGVMRHPWLAAYAGPGTGDMSRSGKPTAFGKSVEELEKAAMDQHQQKRLAYQKQLKAANANASPSSGAGGNIRSVSHGPDAANTSAPSAVPHSGSRSRSTQPEMYYETSADQSLASTPGTAVTTPTHQPTRKTYGSPTLPMDDDDPFAAPGSGGGSGSAFASTSKPVRNDSLAVDNTKSQHKKTTSNGAGGGFRHTIQVEYDQPQGQTPDKGRRGSEDREGARRRESEDRDGKGKATAQGPSPPKNQTGQARRPYQAGEPTKPLPPSPAHGKERDPPNRAGDTDKSMRENEKSSRNPTRATYQDGRDFDKDAYREPRTHRDHRDPNKDVYREPSKPVPAVEIPAPPLDTETSSQEKRGPSASQSSSVKSQGNPVYSPGHKKGRSSVDRLGLGKIFGSAPNSDGAPTTVEADGSTIPMTSEPDGTSPGSGKKSRRNTLTVMVEPFSRSIRGKSKTGARMASTPVASASTDEKANKNATMPSSTASAMSTTSSDAGFANTSGTDVAGGVGMQASTSKAKKVMQWFRTKNKGRESIGLGGDFEEVAFSSEKEKDGSGTPTQAEFNRRVENASDTSNVVVSPVLLVTTPSTPVPTRIPPPVSISPSAPLHPQRTPSSATVDSAYTPSLVTRFRNSITVGGSISGGSASRGSKSVKTGAEALRIHHGAVDQTTVTTGSPPDVMKHVREVLEGMGIEIQVEGEFKYRCVRGKKRKGTMSNGVGVGVVGNVGVNGSNGSGVAAVAMMGTAASNGVDKRGLPVPSQSSFSSTGGMLRGLLMRRQSSQVSSTGLASTSQPSLPYEEDSPITSEPSGLESVYGDPSQDAGDEVRFSVELTRMSGLTGTYSLDIRRLKGNLRSYKFLYDTLRDRANLQR